MFKRFFTLSSLTLDLDSHMPTHQVSYSVGLLNLSHSRSSSRLSFLTKLSPPVFLSPPLLLLLPRATLIALACMI